MTNETVCESQYDDKETGGRTVNRIPELLRTMRIFDLDGGGGDKEPLIPIR